MPTKRVLALDLGGTKTAAAIVAEDGSLSCRESAATRLGDPEAALATMLELGRKVLERGGPVEALGLALPGLVDRRSGTLLHSPSSGWRNRPFGSRLAEAFGLPLYADNDVNACAWAESLFGAGRRLGSLFWMTISTGIGGAMVVGGRVITGATARAGEIGHLVVEPGGRLCGCGNRGCLEAEAAGPAWRRCAIELLEAGRESALAAAAPEAIDARSIAELARAGDGLCREVVERMGAKLARGLAAVLNLLDPESLILGGGVAAALDLLSPVLERELPALVLGGAERPLRIRMSELGYDAALVGAGALALRPY